MSRAPPSAPVCVVCGVCGEKKSTSRFHSKIQTNKKLDAIGKISILSFLLCICAVLLNDMLVIANPFFVNNLKQLSNNKTTQSCLK